MNFTLHDESIKDNCVNYISRLPDNVVWDVVIKKHKSKRSVKQNSLYWLWLTEISEQALTADNKQLSKEEWHHLCSMKYLGIKTIDVCGVIHTLPLRTTTKLKVGEFADYLTQIEEEFLRRGVALTNPEYYEEAMGL